MATYCLVFGDCGHESMISLEGGRHEHGARILELQDAGRCPACRRRGGRQRLDLSDLRFAFERNTGATDAPPAPAPEAPWAATARHRLSPPPRY